MDQNNIVKIADLSAYGYTYPSDVEKHKQLAIKATVLIKSRIRTWGGQPTFFMDLRDDSGEMITAVSETQPATEILFPIIEESNVYIITGFQLRSSDRSYTSIPNPKIIYLFDYTTVEWCGEAPPMEWPLTALNMVHDQGDAHFVNVIGVCTAYNGVVEIEQLDGRPVREVTLEDGTGQVTCSTWVEETSIFENLAPRSVIFVKDARINPNNMGLNTTRYIQVVPPEDPRARAVTEAYLRRTQVA